MSRNRGKYIDAAEYRRKGQFSKLDTRKNARGFDGGVIH
jgi:hypothetical protein